MIISSPDAYHMRSESLNYVLRPKTAKGRLDRHPRAPGRQATAASICDTTVTRLSNAVHLLTAAKCAADEPNGDVERDQPDHNLGNVLLLLCEPSRDTARLVG